MRTMYPLFTVEDYKRLPEGFPAQLLDGCLVREAAPTFEHQDLVGHLYLVLTRAVGRRRVALAPTDVVLDRLNVLQPDVCVFRRPVPRGRIEVGIPLLAFEVLSPSTRSRDRGAKALRLLAGGVEEVWLVDPLDRTITVRTTRGRRSFRDGERARSVVEPAVQLVPRDLFAE